MRPISPLLVLLIMTVLSACAPRTGDYPSLLLRDAERNGGASPRSEEGLALVDTSPPSPQVQDQISSYLRAAETAHRRFLDSLPSARRTVAAGGRSAIESDAYAAAQVAVGDLQAISSQTAFALADLDALLADRSNALLSTDAVLAARSRVANLLQEENAALRDLEIRLR